MTMRIRTSRRIVKTTIGVVALVVVMAHAVSLSAQVASVTLPDAPAPNPLDFEDGQAEQQSPTEATPPATPASSPQTSPKSAAPSLGDLRLTPDQIQGNAQAQVLLDKRTHMLKVHQRLGLLTTIPLAATLLASAGAPCNRNPSAGARLPCCIGLGLGWHVCRHGVLRYPAP